MLRPISCDTPLGPCFFQGQLYFSGLVGATESLRAGIDAPQPRQQIRDVGFWGMRHNPQTQGAYLTLCSSKNLRNKHEHLKTK